MQTSIRIAALVAACVGVAGVASAFVVEQSTLMRPSVVLVVLALAIGVRAFEALRTYQYTAWIIAAVVVGLCYPELLLPLNPDNRSRPVNKWLMLLNIQMVMFGISTQMRLRDFAGLPHMAYAVAIGLLLQFTVMPLTGFALARALDLPNEVAAGVVLIGSCSSGLASNVLTYIAGANLPLSITLTAVGTVMAPLITPLWMKLLAGEMIEDLNFFRMMLQIVEIMLVPLGAALLHDYLRTASTRGRRAVAGAAVAAAAYLTSLAFGGWGFLDDQMSPNALTAIRLSGFVAGAVLVGVGYHACVTRLPRIAAIMPIVSMFGIVYYTAVTTAAGRQELLAIGGLLIVAVAVHNAVGYVLGYWLSRAVGLDRQAARTVSIEVGLQNGGMATGIAAGMGKLGTLGLAAAVFSPWMNVTGSLLANFWRRRPIVSET